MKSLFLKLFKSRINRLTFIILLLSSVLFAVAFELYFTVIANLASEKLTDNSIDILWVILFFVVYLLFVLYSFTLYIRRLHDLNRRSLWLLLLLVPIINFCLLLALIFMPGNNLENRWGSKPNLKPNNLMFMSLAIFFSIVLSATGAFLNQQYDKSNTVIAKHQTQVLLKEGDALLNEGKGEEALEKYQKAWFLSPNLTSNEDYIGKFVKASDMVYKK